MLYRQEDFWKVWSMEYIRNLPAAFQKFRKQGNLEVGSVVLIKEDNLPRMKWSLGVVEKLHVGKDGVPRSANLRTVRGLKTRAVQRLYNLEISEKEVVDSEVEAVGGKVDAQVAVEEFNEVAHEAAVDEVEEVQNDNVKTNETFSSTGRRRRVPKKFDDYVMYD